MSSEMMSRFSLICPCFKPLFRRKKGKYNFESPPEGAKTDDQNNPIIVHSKNNRVDLERKNERRQESTTVEWNKPTNTVEIGGIANATVDLDEPKGSEGIAGDNRTWIDRTLDREKITEEIRGITQNGTVDLDRKASDVVEELEIVPTAQSRLEKLLQAASTEEETEKERQIVGRNRPKEGAEVREELIVIESSAGLQAYSPLYGQNTQSSYRRSEEPPPDIESMDDITEIFKEMSEGKSEIDAYQLQSVLNNCFTQEFEFAGFSDDLCRSMVAMHDDDLSGRLSFREFQELWQDLQSWKETYVEHDADSNGYFDKSEFADVLEQIGLGVNDDILQALSIRYSDREGHIRFDDFVACAVKLKTAITTFKDNAGDEDSAEFTTDQFIQLGMYT